MKTKERILVITNNKNDLTQVFCCLEDEYELVVAEDEQVATRTLERIIQMISLIIIDSKISLSSREKILNTIRKKKWSNVVPVLLISDGIDNNQLEKSFDCGVDDVICYPWNRCVIKNRVRNYVSIYREKNVLKISNDQAQQARFKAETSQKELKRKSQLVEILGSMYSCIVYVNVNKGKYITMECNPSIKRMVGPEGFVEDGIMQAIGAYVSRKDEEEVKKFADHTTLRERLKDRDMVSMEFCGNVGAVVKASIIAADRDMDGKVVHVIYILQNLGEESTTLQNMALNNCG